MQKPKIETDKQMKDVAELVKVNEEFEKQRSGIKMETEMIRLRKNESEVKMRNIELELEETKYEKKVVDMNESYLQRKYKRM